MNFAWRIYRRLAQAFPHEFKMAYGVEMTQLGEDVVEEIAKRQGLPGLIRLIADIAIRVPIEYLEEMRGDLSYALRALVKLPGVALVAIVSMALGIGLTTNVYSTKWALVFRDIPAAAHANRLVIPEKPVSYTYIEQYREQKSLLDGVAALETGVPFNLTFQGDGKPQRIFGQIVSPDYFSVLGVLPQLGRVFSTQIDKPGDAPVVVITDRFWRDRLNSAPEAVGETIRLNGQIATIVGITPKDFNGALAITPSELFVPTTAPALLAPELANDVLHQRHARDFLAMMCLAPGVTIEKAEAALDIVTRHLDEQDPSLPVGVDKGRVVTLVPAGTRAPIPRQMRPVLFGFFLTLMGLIMTLVSMNLANILIARGAGRQKELAIRLAMGASRFRLIRQMVTEGVLLSLLGGAAGFAFAYAISILNSHFTPPTAIPFDNNFALDWRAALFAFELSLICGVGFSLAPALQATRTDVIPALKESATIQLPGYRRFGLRNLLMVTQVAASLTLLLVTGFLVLGISKASLIETNFDPTTMYLLSIDPVRDGYTPDGAQALLKKLKEEIKSSGPVESVALAAQPPYSLENGNGNTQITAENSNGSSRVLDAAVLESVGAGYFAALSEPMLAGREFEEREQWTTAGGSGTSSLPVILNESAERKLFGNESALGKLVRDEKQSYEVTGVVRDLKDGIGIRQAILYLPLTHHELERPPAAGLTILVRSSAGADALGGIRKELAVIDPNLSVFRVQTLAHNLDQSRMYMRLSVQAYIGIGVFGLLLAAIGLAGVTAYAVAQRRKEIGIRTALGATKGQVLRLVLREGTALVFVGTVVGFFGALAIARILSALADQLVEYLRVGIADPRLLIGAPLLLAAVAMIACYIPARRSARIDPLEALREE
jgi:macrolide transport system ATP-binding/permease protein